MCRSRRELSNPYLIAKIRFDTAEKEPSKVCRTARAVAVRDDVDRDSLRDVAEDLRVPPGLMKLGIQASPSS